jgi:deoxyribose-phosphate aldolase
MTMSATELASYFDHTLLRPNVVAAEIDTLCREATEFGFSTVCVNPIWVAHAALQLKDSGVDVCSVVGFPLGQHSKDIKTREAAVAVADGAREIDMVIRLDALLSDDDRTVRDDITAVVQASYPAVVKVIIETCYLTDELKRKACQLSVEAGAVFVKTSTGFGSGGASVDDIRLMRTEVGAHFGVKASGGIRSFTDALALIDAGATRLGASASVSIVQEMIAGRA